MATLCRLIIEAARVGISHHNQPSFAEVFDGLRGSLIAMAEAAVRSSGRRPATAPVAEAPVSDAAAEDAAEAAPLIPEEAAVDAPVVVAPSITIKKIMDDGHGGAHGGAWKIALADMMTAMMAFFLLMWLLGASNADQRKSIADYFKPTSHSNVTMGKLAGSNGILGGRSSH